jgi:hypothetical protein
MLTGGDLPRGLEKEELHVLLERAQRAAHDVHARLHQVHH